MVNPSASERHVVDGYRSSPRGGAVERSGQYAQCVFVRQINMSERKKRERAADRQTESDFDEARRRNPAPIAIITVGFDKEGCNMGNLS